MFIRLTRPDGSPVYLDPAIIQGLYPNTGQYHQAAHAVLITSQGPQAVQETIEQVEAKIKG